MESSYLIQAFESKLAEYGAHQSRVIHQYKQFRLAKFDIQTDEIVLHVDFSENYTTKYGEETQAAHFGHHRQIVIHQGVCYKHDKPPQSFATISDDTRKTAEAVAAHINAYLLDVEKPIRKVSKINKLYIYMYIFDNW